MAPDSIRGPARISAVVGAVLLAGLGSFVVGCAGGGGESCPAGYRETPDGCLPPLAQDVGGGGTDAAVADVPPDEDGGPRPDGDGPVPDVPGDAGADAPLPPPDVPEPTGQVGDPCRRDDQCEDGLICLGWIAGYCTLYGCDAAGADCPDDAVCLPLVDNAAACFRGCEPDGPPCRPDEPRYACKLFPGDDGAPVSVCHETRSDAAGNGAACESHAACEGSRTCLTSLPGGACLQLFCERDSDCEAPDSVCARFDGQLTCLLRCAADADCAAVGDGSLVCGEIRNLGGQTVGACLSSAAALPVGAACLSDAECNTAVCETLGAGRCTTGEPRQPCDNADDCPFAGFCELLPVPLNSCSAACGATASQRCPDGGCVLDRDGEAACRPTCEWDAGHTTHDCREGVGWTCVFGIPLKDEGNRGYHCANLAPGDVGTACEEDDDCDALGASCVLPPNAGPRDEGLCTRGCSPQSPCPYGSYCFTQDGVPRCLRVCFTDLDCPAAHLCDIETAVSTVHKICVAP